MNEEKLHELVDKATKQKPIMVADKGFAADASSSLRCPNCKHRIVNVWSKKDYKPRYCHYCGQKLDWGENYED